MKITPAPQETKQYFEKGYKRVPLTTEILADSLTPIEALRKLQNVSGHCFLLESAEVMKTWGRYSFLGFEPTMEIACSDGTTVVTESGVSTTIKSSPVKILRAILAENKSPELPGLPPFAGGLSGYFSYDFIKYAEPELELTARDDEGFRDLDLMLFDKLIVFDHYRQKILLIAGCHPGENGYEKAAESLRYMKNLLLEGAAKPDEPGTLLSPFRQMFDEEQYCLAVTKAKDYIRSGDIFQVVLSNRLDADFKGSLLDMYRVLRTENPSPYMFYFSGDMEFAGASPETLVKLENGELSTFPLAGTTPRGATPEEDEALEKKLLSDEKELAEHNMLVDLGRNDLGKISEFGTVRVDEYQKLLRFSHVTHIGSTIRSKLRDGFDALDVVSAVLPAGTLSGAPKFRACQIINELEDNKRGLYGGAIGYLDFRGNLDTCIAIRLAYKKNNKVFVRSGAGIVADSVPEKEYRECINKAKAVLVALKDAEEVTSDDSAD